MPTSLLLLPLLGGGTAHAACPTPDPDLTVCANGCDFTTIANALAAAVTDDVICVAGGNYSSRLALTTGKRVRIEGDVAAVVNVQTGSGTEIVAVSGGGDLELVGIDVNGNNQRRCLDVTGAGSSLLLDGVVVSGCTFDVSGGGARATSGATLTVRDSAFTSNHNNSNAGGAIQAVGATLVVQDSTFTNNYADDAGAIDLDDATCTISGSTFDGNDANPGDGGGVRAQGTTALTVDESTFTGDTAPSGYGGGVAFFGTGALRVTDTVFDGCNADANGGGGGGMRSTGADVQVLRSSFFDCDADNGGGLQLSGATAGSIVASNVFQNDTCSGWGGGALVDGTLQVRNNVFVDNDCSGGGSDGDGLFVNGGTVDLRNNVFAYHGGQGAHRQTGTVTSNYNSFYSNGTNVSAITLGANEIFVDPRFATFTNDNNVNDNFYPAVGSPLINAGDPAITDIDGSRSDIGLSGGPHAPDQDGDGSFLPFDCDDDDDTTYPNAPEVAADGVDQDCDGSDACYRDVDGDGYGGNTLVDGSFFCAGANEIDVADDCNDNAVGIHPGAAEVAADGVDQDCDGADSCYRDADDDNFGGSTLVDETDGSCTDDPNQSSNNQDCDDNNPSRSPGLSETPVNGVDNDCDGQEDCYRDNDGDNHGGTNLLSSADLTCNAGQAAPNNDDCDDNNAQRYPGNTETAADGVDGNCDNQELCWRDGDRDTYGTTTTVASPNLSCADAGESTNTQDCNDGNANIKPGAPETVGDGVDQDCDTHDSCYDDADGDGAAGTTVIDAFGATCSAARDEYPTTTDCRDNDPNTYPGATERVNNGNDEDCDGQEACYRDMDEDTFGANPPVQSADLDCTDRFEANDAQDCNDAAAGIHPNAAEVTGDAVDQNCDGQWSCWTDGDRDTFGSTVPAVTNAGACGTVAGFALVNTDCDDTRASVKPGGTEVADDGIDQDCSGEDTVSCVPDADQDGYGTDVGGAPTIYAADGFCDQTQGEADTADDCDDRDDAIHPNAPEVRNNAIDEDCDGSDLVDCYVDSDNDNFGDSATNQSPFSGDCDLAPFLADQVGDCDGNNGNVYPGAPERCNDGVDSDCSSVGFPVDEDQDGLAYPDERAHGTDDCDPDSDADGLRDGPEVLAGCDPASADTDSDTVPDGTEWGVPTGPPADTDNDGTFDPLDEDDDDDLVDSLVEEGLGVDWDGDGAPNRIDPDDDGDGLLTALEDPDGDNDPRSDDTDIDGTANWLDEDDDGDGIDTVRELAVLANPLGLDSDGDTVPDAFEWPYGQGLPPDRDTCMSGTVVTACPDGIPDIVDPDDDGDNIPTSTEGIGDFDSDNVPNYLDPDTDGDTRSDLSEGVGDADDDGAPNYKDPIDDDGPTGDPDLDGLSTNDERGLCLPAPQAGVCSDPNDPDTNDDLVPDGTEAPSASAVDTDADGDPDWTDPDDDGDGYPTDEETGFLCDDGTLPTLSFDLTELLLQCEDGSQPVFGPYRDTDGDSTPDYLDADDDGDGVPTLDEDPEGDHDGDGLVDPFDPQPDDGPQGDLDGDGLTNEDEEVLGTFPWSEDSDNDGVSDGVEAEQADSDGDGTPDVLDDDDDGDGLPTIEEGRGDTDGDTTPDYLDEDSDDDGSPDAAEADGDSDCDARPDVIDAVDDDLCGGEGPSGALHYARQGCGCASGGPSPTWLGLGLLLALARRRKGAA